MEKSIEYRNVLRETLPKLSDERLSEVEGVLQRFCDTVWHIYERLDRDRPELIDGLIESVRMNTKVDSTRRPK